MYQPHNMTIYNRVECDDETEWIATQLKGVFWDSTTASSVSANGFQSSDSLFLTIPFSVDSGGKKFVSPDQYCGNGWTLRDGDIVVKGLVSKAITGRSDLSGYMDVFTIRSVDTKDFGSPEMQHWEVAGS